MGDQKFWEQAHGDLLAPRLREFPTWSFIDAVDLSHPGSAQELKLKHFLESEASAETVLKAELNGPVRSWVKPSGVHHLCTRMSVSEPGKEKQVYLRQGDVWVSGCVPVVWDLLFELGMSSTLC